MGKTVGNLCRVRINFKRNKKMVDQEQNQTKPIVIVVEKTSNKKSIKKSYKSKAATVIGIIHIICGFLAFFANVGLFFIQPSYRFHFGGLATGIWNSVFFFIAGGLSIGSGRNSSSCLVIGSMVMSILSAISAGILIIFSGLGLGLDCYYRSACTQLEILHGLELVAGIVEMVIAITSSVLSCKATCCRDKLDTSNPFKVMYRADDGGSIDPEKIMNLSMKINQTDGGIPTRTEEVDFDGKPFDYNKF